MRWFALSAFAITALRGRIASGYFACKWALSGVTGGTTPLVTGDSIGGMSSASVIDHTAKVLSRVTIGGDQQRRLLNITPILSIGVVALVIALVNILNIFANKIYLAENAPYRNHFMNLLMILDSFADLELLEAVPETHNFELRQINRLNHKPQISTSMQLQR